MTNIPHAPKGKVCPLRHKDMSKVCHECPWWTQLRGKHPQTGADIDEWACAVTFLPILLIENAKETRQSAAATETLRNIIVEMSLPSEFRQLSGNGRLTIEQKGGR